MDRIEEMRKHCPGCMNVIEPEWEHCPCCGFSTVEYEKERDVRMLPAGSILSGRYEIGIPLGGGGFGITYLAWDQKEDCQVAIKEYFPWEIVRRNTSEGGIGEIQIQGKEEKERYERGLKDFAKEGNTLAKFQQLNGIVPVREFFQANQTAYLVMDYISGINLKEYMEKTGKIFDEKSLLDKMKPLIQSLDVIHKGGMIHRDISPDNIIMDEKGRLTLIDFGAARIMEEEQNRSTTLLMKYGYAPEEQYRSRGKLGPWSDIYALCATMYYLLTGVRPVQSIDRLAEDDMPSLSKMGIRISERTSDVIEKGMAVYSENRYQDLESFSRDLYDTKQEMVFVKQPIKSKNQNKSREDRNTTSSRHGKTLEKWILFLSFIVAAIVGSFIFMIGTGRMNPQMLVNKKIEEQDPTILSEEKLETVTEGKIYALFRAKTDTYSGTQEKILRKAAEERGFTKVTCRFYEEDEFSQNECIKEAIRGEYDAIICDPGYRAFYMPLFDQAVDAGIPIFIVNHGTDYEKVVTYIGADTSGGMKTAAMRLKEILGGKGMYAELLGNENIASAKSAREAIDEVMEESEMELFSTVMVGRDNKSAEEEMEQLLLDCPDLKGVLCNNNSIGKGAAKAIKKAGLQGEVHVVTIGGSNKLKEITEEGLVDAVVVRPLDDMLERAVNQVARLINQPDYILPKKQKVPCILLNSDEIYRMDNYSVEDE